MWSKCIQLPKNWKSICIIIIIIILKTLFYCSVYKFKPGSLTRLLSLQMCSVIVAWKAQVYLMTLRMAVFHVGRPVILASKSAYTVPVPGTGTREWNETIINSANYTCVFLLWPAMETSSVTNEWINEWSGWLLKFSNTHTACNCTLVFPSGTSTLRLYSVTVSWSGCSFGLEATPWGSATIRCVCSPPTSTAWSFATYVNSSSDVVRTSQNDCFQMYLKVHRK